MTQIVSHSLTPTVLNRVSEISELLGRLGLGMEQRMTPRLRRENRVRSIQASLAIENNTLSVEQVSAVLDGKRILGHPREIQEVRNAFAAYEAMSAWSPTVEKDLLSAHALLMQGLVDDAGQYRQKGVGVYRGKQLVHTAPPAKRVPLLMDNLLEWLAHTELHPLVASSLFHYELEFIHPFNDGNGRMGRLWQSLILQKWKPLFAYLPVESVIREKQDGYYHALTASDQAGDATLFVEYMLDALHSALIESASSDYVSDQVSDYVLRLVSVFTAKDHSVPELMQKLGLAHRPTFRKNYLNPALDAAYIERTHPESPRSPTQRYRLTAKAREKLLSKS